MKLLYCLSCGDIVRIYSDVRACHCGKSMARYTGDRDALVGGLGRIIGVDTKQFYSAVQAAESGFENIDRADEGRTCFFPAFVAPDGWPTVRKIGGKKSE